jgi:hypothetical protein
MRADRYLTQRRRPNVQTIYSQSLRKNAFNERMSLIVEIALSMLIFSAAIVSIYLQGI